MVNERPLYVDGLQYSRWSREIFEEMRDGGLSAVHVTVSYWEDFRDTVSRLVDWNHRFEAFSDLIVPARNAGDIQRAHEEGKVGVVFGFQNCSPIDDDVGLVEILHDLGARIMQLSYNNQSLLATGCYETEDPGITRMGRQVIKEMNRVGMVIDMSHSAERSTLEAIELSERPTAITHANPYAWAPALRNKSNDVLKALSESKGMIGFSLYPHHLRGKSACSLQDFCEMAARTAELVGVGCIGIGSDLCRGHDDSTVEWMRNGRWTKDRDFGEGSADRPGWPEQPSWFQSSRDFPSLEEGLRAVGFAQQDVAKVMGRNWLDFFERSFEPMGEGSGKSRLSARQDSNRGGKNV